jgi:hypothetical protein
MIMIIIEEDINKNIIIIIMKKDNMIIDHIEEIDSIIIIEIDHINKNKFGKKKQNKM